MRKLIVLAALLLSACVQPGVMIETLEHEAQRLAIPVQIDGVYCIVYRSTGIDCDFENHLGRNGE
jgi:hypothetical protein